MKKKGFTLVELLAIIVVLAVLAIVAVPVLTNVIKDSKIKAFQTKIYALESATETYYDDLILEEEFDVFERGIDGTYALTIDLSNKEQVKKLNIKTFNKGMLTITEDGNISITAIEDNYCGQKLHSSNVVNMLNIKEDFTCYLLNSSSGDLGTQDILSAIQNLKSDAEDLKTENKSLKSSNEDLKESIKNLSDNGIGSITALNKIYPVGSIYVSTTLKNVEEVEKALGGEWESYGDGRVLKGTTGTSGQTGGLSDVSLTTANLPEQGHSYTPSGTIKSTFTGDSATSSSNGAHTHTVTANGSVSSSFTGTDVTSGSTGSGYTLTWNTTGTNNASTGNQSANHTHSIPALSGTAATAGLHQHGIANNSSVDFTVANGIGSGVSNIGGNQGSYGAAHWFTSSYYIAAAGAHTHSVTTNASTTGSNSANHNHKYTNRYVTGVSGVQAHTHTVKAAGSVSSSFTGKSATSSEAGAHTHTVTAKGSVSSTFTGTASTTGKTGSNTAFSVLDPYITVYMYKRVK